jgi:hypothetical protein
VIWFEVLDGVRSALRRWQIVVVTAGMIATAALTLATTGSQVLTQVAVLKAGSTLRDRGAVSFTPHYAAAEVSHIDRRTVVVLSREISQERAYTTVLNNLGLDNPALTNGAPIVAIFGKAPLELYSSLSLCSPAPCAMRGTRLIGEAPAAIDFIGHHIPIVESLPEGSKLFDPSLNEVSLDSSVVVRLPPRDLMRISPIEREEAITRAVMLSPPEGAVADYVEGAAKGGLYLVPHDLRVTEPQEFSKSMADATLFTLGFIAFAALAFFGFVSATVSMLRRERPAFAIRELCGASPRSLRFRIAGYVATTPTVFLGILVCVRGIGRGSFGLGESCLLALVLVVFTLAGTVTWRRDSGERIAT